MNILKKTIEYLFLAFFLLLLPQTARSELLIDREPGARRDDKLTRELEMLERSIRELLSRSRKKDGKLITVRFSGAVPPGEVRLIRNRNNPILEFDRSFADSLKDRRCRQILYHAFYVIYHTRESGACWVRPQLPQWLTDALDRQQDLMRQTILLKGNYDLPVLRAYAEWGHLPPPEAVMPPAAMPETAVERRCRAEYGFLLLTAIRDDGTALRQYLDSSRFAASQQQRQLFDAMVIPILLRQARRHLPDDPKKPPTAPGRKMEQYLLQLAAKLAWTPVGVRPAANVLSQLQATISIVTVVDEKKLKQRCPLGSLPRILTTLPAAAQQKTHAAITRELQRAVTGSSRPVHLAARTFLKSLNGLPRERRAGDERVFEAAEQAFQRAAHELFAVLQREAAIDLVLEHCMASQKNLPFKNDGVPQEFTRGEPLNRSVEALLDDAERRYL